MLSLTKPLINFPYQHQHHLPSPRKHRSLTLTRSTGDEGAELESVRPPETVEIRFKRGSRRRRRADGEGGGLPPKKKAVVKSWDEMSLSEKALELYVGEKGLLFWLNKFAYASIFIIIGGWILFRFVGPALNLYQLDAPPLPPTSLLKGS